MGLAGYTDEAVLKQNQIPASFSQYPVTLLL